MKFHYYPETDSLYIDLAEDHTGTDSLEIADGVVIDSDEQGTLVGIDIDHASKVTDLSQLNVAGLPRSRFHFSR